MFLVFTAGVKMYHIAIVEDDSTDRKSICDCLERYGRETAREFKTTEFCNAVSFLEGYTPVYDAVFIDIQMPYIDGMSAAAKLRESDVSVPLVFITNMSKYAVKGYSVNAVDFVVKPIMYGNFQVMMNKVLRLADNRAESAVLKTADGRIRIALDTVSYIDVLDHRVCYHTDGGDFTVWESLKEQEARLPSDKFVKCNNYCLVNLKYVDGITEGNVLVGGTEIPLSRSRKKEFSDRLLAYYGKYL